jgi:Spy/CpxP family protein refolding chaperone
MKNRLAIMGLALALGVPAFAQEAKTKTDSDTSKQSVQEDRMERRHARRGMMKDRLAQELNLTDAQKTQLRNMHQQNREQMKAIKTDDSLTQEQKKEKFKALHESRQAQMNSILTPDQQQKFAQIKENRKGKMGKRGKHGKGRRHQQESTGNTGF